MEVLQNTGATLWSESDYDKLWLDIFRELTGSEAKSNVRLIDEAIGKINDSLNGYKLEYSSIDDRLYIVKNDKRYPVSLVDNNGLIASKVDGTTITIDENGVLHGNASTVPDGVTYISDTAVDTPEIIPINADLLNGHADTYFATATEVREIQEQIDGKANKSTKLLVTIPASGWTGTEAPYTNTIEVVGATAENNIEFIPTADITVEQVEAYQAAQIINGTQTDGTVTLNCWGTVPGIDLHAVVIVRGD